MNLSHSSLYEFLEEHETQTLLLEQAGDDFRVDEAIAVGRLANLVYQMRRTQALEESGIKELILVALHSVEMAQRSTGLIQTELISIFDEVLHRNFGSCGLALGVVLGDQRDPFDSEGTESNPAYLGPQGFCDHRSYLLTVAVNFGFSCYLKHMITTSCGIPFKNGTPLLFYPLWTTTKFINWNHWTSSAFVLDEKCHVDPVKLLLATGADPNECRQGLTPWSVVLQRLCPKLDDDLSFCRGGPQDAIPWPEKSLLDTLEVAKLMLQYGADPFLCVETPSFTISPQVFAELLRRECCNGNACKDCVCAYAREIQPQLTELVDLVEERKYLKQQMRTDGELLLIGAWLVVVSAYILQSVLS
jgi:hypothetical protein